MFTCPYCLSYNSYFRSPINSFSYIRILHASPNAPAVDILINNRPMFKDIPFKKFTNYINLPTGLYNIKIFASGTTVNPIVNTDLFIPGGIIYTIAVTDNFPHIRLFPILDVRRPIVQGKTLIRFIHLSPNTPNVDITLPNGVVLFRNIGYKEVTKYIPIEPGEYTLDLRISGIGERILTVPGINLKSNRFYTVYAVGYASKSPKLQALIPLDGNSYLQFI
jgi:hypothetical protein